MIRFFRLAKIGFLGEKGFQKSVWLSGIFNAASA
jgi:hypothetical protein